MRNNEAGREKPQLDDGEGFSEDTGEIPLRDTTAVKTLPTHGTYVRSCRKTLHRVGECHKIPGSSRW